MFGHWTYLAFELGWALPVLTLHWALDRRRLRAHFPVLLLVAVGMTIYLSVADGVAIHAGIWTLHRDRIVGLYLANVPIEESIFFLTTNLMVAQSLILLGPRVSGRKSARHVD
jgi:lycopene beta-cyclase